MTIHENCQLETVWEECDGALPTWDYLIVLKEEDKSGLVDRHMIYIGDMEFIAGLRALWFGTVNHIDTGYHDVDIQIYEEDDHYCIDIIPVWEVETRYIISKQDFRLIVIKLDPSVVHPSFKRRISQDFEKQP